MSRLAGTGASALLSVLMTAASLILTSGRVLDPSDWISTFWIVALLAGPIAVYLGYCFRLYLEIVADPDHRGLHAHVIALGLAALFFSAIVSYYVMWWGFTQDALRSFIPQTLSGAVAGCTGLAWGALWSLPRPREEAHG